MKRLLWKVKEADEVRALALAQKFSLSAAFAQILINRNIAHDAISDFLNPTLTKLHDPLLLPDMERAVERIKAATKKGEKIMIVGDYDVDGITSLAIFNEYIKHFPDTFTYYIPHRVKEGYGLNKEAVEKAKQLGASVLLCFDCGTNAHEELALAQRCGCDTIVVDHHLSSSTTTDCFAFINPKRKDSKYPFPDLSSAALSFKLLQALRNEFPQEVLDLVALSLVCDVVPLVGENRILVKEGIKYLRKTERPAIKALCQQSKLKQENIEHFHIGFILGPRLNASGRVSSAHEALDIFLTEDSKKIMSLTSKLQEYNQLRKSIEARTREEAEALIDRDNCDHAIVVHGDNWHPGVLGIVASRLTDKYYRPSFVISFEDDFGKGSARSIHSVHLIEALDTCAQHLHGYGGHKKAAGIQIFKNELDSFREKINDYVKNEILPHDLLPQLAIDLAIGFDQISMDFLDELELLSPHGEENPAVIFMTSRVVKKSEPQKIAGRYSLWLSDAKSTLEAVVSDPGIVDLLGYAKEFDIAYSLEKNYYHTTPRLTIRDVRIATA